MQFECHANAVCVERERERERERKREKEIVCREIEIVSE